MSHDLHFTVDGEEPVTPAGLTGTMDHQGVPNAGGVSSPQQQQQGGAFSQTVLKESAHPVACIFHVLFKGLALGLYIYGVFFAKNRSSNFITFTVFCVLFLAADFWVTKNVTGRLLVGLRWWNQVEGDNTRWIFESKGNEATVNPFDRRIFWTVLYMTPLTWACLGLIELFRLELGWLIAVCMALSLNGANVYGYYKCSSDQKAKFQQMMAEGAQRGAMAAFSSNLFGMLVGNQAAAAAGGADAASTTSSITQPTTTPAQQTYV